MATTPTSKKVQVGLVIKRMIEAKGLSYAEAGKLIGISQSRISELVAGKGSIGMGDLKLLSERLGFTDDTHIDFLLSLRADWNKRGAWSSYTGPAVFHEDVQLIVDMEWDALSMRCVGSEIVPGLLQCEHYIRAVFANWTSTEGRAAFEDVVRTRVERQAVLDKPGNPLQLHAVLSESCLRREVGGAQTMIQQLKHLGEVSRRPNVILQVIPFKVMPTGTAVDRFQLLELPSSGLIGPIGLAYTESPGEIRFIDRMEALISYHRAWSRLTAVALSPDETRKFLRYIAGTYR
jgi:transcriptional regulator with XRE-family HTH domain